MNKLNWLGENALEVNNVKFIVEHGQALYDAQTNEPDTFVLGKSRNQLEALAQLEFDRPVRSVCELGIYKGGSVVFYRELFEPEKIVAFDLSPNRVASLDKYIAQRNLQETVRCFYGVDQSDKKTLADTVQAEMSGAPFDLVIDDASHLVRQTRASFDVLFPVLAPGGYYIIEDWGWAHWNFPQWQKRGGVWPRERPLTNLIFELGMLLASRPDLVESMFLLPSYAVVRKSRYAGPMDAAGFSISESYLNRGRRARLLR